MTNTMDLKSLVRNDLNKIKEKEKVENIKKNSKLKEITLYTKKNHPMCKNYLKIFTEEGIKFKEKDIEDHKVVLSTVQLANFPIIYVNKNYLVQGRDFQNPKQAANALLHFADPNYEHPPFEDRLIESIKNLNQNIQKNIGHLSKQIQPVIKILTNLAEEDKSE